MKVSLAQFILESGYGKSELAQNANNVFGMAEFEAYALGQKKSYDASIDEVEALRKKHEALMEQLSEAEDKIRELNRMKVHENFAVTRLTDGLLDEYVESIEVHLGNEVKISWK